MSKKVFFIFELVRKKSFFIILGLSVVVTYGVAIIDAMARNSLLAGEAGFPLRFSNSSFFSSESTEYIILILDIIFWFVIIWGIWKILQKLTNK